MLSSKDINKVIAYNDPKFNYIKLAEELAELQEVVIKRYNKKPENAPPLAKIIEEAGDVLLRIKLLCVMEDISADVNNRAEEKLEKLIDYINKGKYKRGV